MPRKLLVIAIGLAVLVLNPFFGCDADRSFTYGADEMRAAVEGTWKLMLPATQREPAREIVFSISQGGEPTQDKHSRTRGMVSPAAACSHRSLVKAAAACVDISEMPLDIKRLAGTDVASGRLRVFGLTFRYGLVDLDLGGSNVHARIEPTGTISEVRIDGYAEGAPAIVRLSTAQR